MRFMSTAFNQPAGQPVSQPDSSVSASPSPRRFPCRQCGAKVEFAPGQDALICPYCSTKNEIKVQGEVSENDLNTYLAKLEAAQPHVTASIVKCDSCGAEATPPVNVTSFSCPFCSSNIVAKANECSIVKPHAVLPFKLTRDQAMTSFRTWINSRWFAPNALKERASIDNGLSGMYVPHWTFDAFTTTRYRGQRGDAYYVTVTVTIQGKPQTRQERRIRWSPASGTVQNTFDNLLVQASSTLDVEEVRELNPWDLSLCLPYQDDYLAGFRAERYQLPLADGFHEAQDMMQPAIQMAIRQDIGGDDQRIEAMNSTYSNVTFKHILLPIWVSAYRFGGKVFTFMINAQTGEVRGKRPYSPIKIALAVIAALVVIAIIVFIASRK
jgi:DNA-directed RNA polymerase subunit RPC12/RpoP